jgi:hypothetical protein
MTDSLNVVGIYIVTHNYYLPFMLLLKHITGAYTLRVLLAVECIYIYLFIYTYFTAFRGKQEL